MSVFLKEPSWYKRSLNPIQEYIKQTSFFISKMTGLPINEATDIVTIDAKQNFIDPKVVYFERDEEGDTNKTECSLTTYISSVKANEELLAPTFTTYLNPKVKPSILVEFIDENKNLRNVAKLQAFEAEAAGKHDLYIIKNNEQTNKKLANNSISGGFATKSCILHNPTAHNTLTSITRTMSSISNASNEKIISGNRHYYNPTVTLNNVISITSNFDRQLLEDVILKYGLVYPTVEDTIKCIKYSSDIYWRGYKDFGPIEDYVNKLDPLERAAFVYIGDLHHLRVLNDGPIKEFLTRLSFKATKTEVEDLVGFIKKADGEIVNFAHQVCVKEMRGKGKNYKELPLEDLQTLVATIENINSTLETYLLFIEAFFLSTHIPASTAFISNMVRRCVVMSDTDSTVFAVDEYVDWYFGYIAFTDEAIALAASIMFIATQCMAHALAMFSANINVPTDKLGTLAMKPEYSFPVFCQTPVAKHYFTCIAVKEGNVHNKLSWEHKGVHLKNSAAPKRIIAAAQSKMNNIVETIMRSEKISINEELKDVADLERSIRTSVLNGETEFYKSAKMKEPESYTLDEDKSPYQHHMLWNEVFAPKYGDIEKPPYATIKVPTIIGNKTAIKDWILSIQDKALAERLSNWLNKQGKTSLPTMYLSTVYVKAYGIPEEIKIILSVRKIQLDLTITNRLILETLGFFPKPDTLIEELGY